MTGAEVKRRVMDATEPYRLRGTAELPLSPDIAVGTARAELAPCRVLTPGEVSTVLSAVCPHDGSRELADVARAILRGKPR